ncbi:MAG: hypothetical protein AMXMBFR82_12240 [Candidatus Hydrogenedentota bacterium]
MNREFTAGVSPERGENADSAPYSPTDDCVGVLIVNRNKRDYLLRALEHVFASTHPHLKVVVADDHSVDDSVAAVRERHPDVHVIVTHERRGAPGIRNDGIQPLLEDSSVRFVVFLDNDAFVDPGAISAMMEAANRDPSIGIVAPKAFRNRSERILYSAGELRVNFCTGTVRDVGAGEVDKGQHDVARAIQACASFAMLVRREVIEVCDGFDEAFYPYGWEDVDFTLRARQHGYTIWYAPAATVEHLGGKMGRGLVLDYEIAKARNLFRLMARHASWLQWVSFLIVLPWRAALMVLSRILGRVMIGSR